jgi:outer membrane immunogenic protein
MLRNSLLSPISGVAFLGIAALCISSASAADLHGRSAGRSVTHDWSGFYVGGNVGYAWGTVNDNVSNVDSISVPSTFGVDKVTPSGKLGGWLGGVQAGYNWQTGLTVFGVEADIDFGTVKGDTYQAPLTNLGVPIAGSYYSVNEKIKWFGTLRGRIGFTPVDQWLVYATGGLAYAKIEHSAVMGFTGGAYTGSESTTKLGWTLGAGTEWAIGNNWSAKFEYLYFDLGATSVTARLPGNTQYLVLNEFTTRGNLVRIGLNRRF